MTSNGLTASAKMAIAIAQRKSEAERTFGEMRAAEVMATAMVVYNHSTVGLLSSLEICMQIEDEFRGQVEEIVGRAFKLIEDTEGKVGTMPQSLMQVILTERFKNG